MNKKAFVIALLCLLLGGGGAFIAIDMSTNISQTTNEGDTFISNLAEDLVLDIICPEEPSLAVCEDWNG